MKKLPVLPTIMVAAAVAVMIGLGVWQIQRAHWKEGLLAEYRAAQGLPPIAFPMTPDPKNPPLFRRAAAFCTTVTGWRTQSGRNRKSEPGWLHIASCSRGGAEGPGFQAVMGWSKELTQPKWRGGRVEGTIAPDREWVVRLVSTEAAPGLEPAQLPSIEDIPNNHRFYAFQWFFFAAAALVIYVLALRKRSR